MDHDMVSLDVMDPSVGYVDVELEEDDSIKLFVGQIPKTWEEEDVRQVLEPFGAIEELTVLKDRVSGTHKGCAFVTYTSPVAAAEAQKVLHEKKTLPGMNHPMQVKPANKDSKPSTPVEERRLFVGMLSKNLTEDDVKAMFSVYGPVEDVSILRNKEGWSKGAAFVRMSTKAQALQAITALHQSQTMPGCSAPLVVKVADTEKEKNAKRLQQAVANFGGVNNIGLTTAFELGTLGAAAYYQQLLRLQQATQGSANNSFGLGTGGLGGNLALAALAQQSPPPAAVGGGAGGGYGTPAAAPHPTGLGNGLGNLGSAVLSAAAASQQKTLHPPPPAVSSVNNDIIMQAYLGVQPPQQQQAVNLTMDQGPYVYQKQREGPEGSNLFIYHLPNDVKDDDLIQMFAPFGSVVSAKVFIDKYTSLSKCFGFVSYDNPLSAQSAIQAMNGFQIGTKRLKVQLKRPKDANKPY